MKKKVYIDMDNVLVDFPSGIAKIDTEMAQKFEGDLDEVPGIFALMDPITGAIEAVQKLSKKFDLYVLTTAPWLNPTAWIDKIEWVHRHFGKDESSVFYKRLIISHHKNLNAGDYLIDDRPNNGAKDFAGEWIQFGSAEYPDWNAVIEYLLRSA